MYNEPIINISSSRSPEVVNYNYRDAIGLVQKHIQSADYRAACEIALQVAKALPKDPTAQILAAEALIFNHQAEKSIAYSDQLATLLDDPSPALIMKSRAAFEMNDPEQSLDHLEAAISRQPNNAVYQCEKGDLHKKIGNLGDAEQCYHKALDIDIKHTVSFLNLTLLPGYDCPEELLQRVEAVVQSNQLQPLDRGHALFALANVYDAKGDGTRHFARLNAANKIFEDAYQFNTEVLAKDAQSTIDYFSAELFQQYPIARQNTRKIIFIIGMPRSGSTLVDQILCSHSSVAGAGENRHFINALEYYGAQCAPDKSYPHGFTNASVEKLQVLADEYLNGIAYLNNNHAITDKTLGNYHYVGILSLLFPNARFVHVKRHPIATCYACYKRPFAVGNLPWSYNMNHIEAYYRSYDKTMKHWDRVLPGRIHHLEYEALVARQRETTQALLDFCELPWDENCLEFHKTSRNVSSLSNAQVRQELYSSAVNQWRNYEEHLGPLSALIELQ